MSGTIVVGFDVSEPSRRALRWALDEAELCDATVKVILAWTLPVAVASVPYDTLDYEALRDAGEAEARQAVDEVLAERSTKPEVEFELVHEHPGQALIDGSADADLLVVGSRGRGGFAGLLLGSTSTYCVHHARVPVVVVRPASEA